jgi:hypothetical protein
MQNNEFIVYNLGKFCLNHSLSKEILRRNINKGKILQPTNKKDQDRQRLKSKNTIGWEIKE